MATKKWANLRSEIVAELGSDVLAEARRRTENYVDANRLADHRKALGVTQILAICSDNLLGAARIPA